MSISGKNILITGATKGMGKAVAIELAKAGANLVLHYNGGKDSVEKMQLELKPYKGNFYFIQADFSSSLGEIENLYKKTIESLGSLDILINNAGVGYLTPIDKITEHDFDLHFNVNVKAVFFLCKQAILTMNSGGNIINYSGGLVKVLRSGVSCYSATKGAVEQITRGLAFEAAERNITINAIAPGAIETEMTHTAMSEQEIKDLCAHTAFGRLGKPEDIARAIKTMLSDDFRWTTGQIIHVNGGWV